MSIPSNEQAQAIAAAAIALDAARKQLAESERLGQLKQARDDRRRVSAAEFALDALVAEVQ